MDLPAAPNVRDARVTVEQDALSVPLDSGRPDATISFDSDLEPDAGLSDTGPVLVDVGEGVDQSMPRDSGPAEQLDALVDTDARVELNPDAALALDAAIDGGAAPRADGSVPDAHMAEVDMGDAPVPDMGGVDFGAGGPGDAASPVAGGVGLLISEYVEGSGNNKALELFNTTGAALSLAGCVVQIYANGRVEPSSRFELAPDLQADAGPGMETILPPFGRYVVCNGRAGEVLRPRCQQTTGWLNFNGNDAVVLRCGDAVRDVFGQIGLDPGQAWGDEAVSTVDATLRRGCQVMEGDEDGDDAFEPNAEWAAFPQDTFDGLGVHCGHDD